MQQKIANVKYQWVSASLETMKQNYFTLVVNIFKAFEISITPDFVAEIATKNKRAHIEALLNTDLIKNAWVAEYECEPNEEDVDNIYNLLLFIEQSAEEEILEGVSGAFEYFEQNYKNEPTYVLSSEAYLAPDWSPLATVEMNDLVVNMDQQTIAIMHQKTFNEFGFGSFVTHKATASSLDELLVEISKLQKDLPQLI